MLDLILASQSPRRKEILENLGFPFRVITADTDETCTERDPRRYVETLALRKGKAVLDRITESGTVTEETLIIAADTVVAAGGEILGKPRDKEDAARMLRLLSGTTHQVISGVALLSSDRSAVASEVTGVRFASLSDKDLNFYLNSGEPYDKAGAYAVQGLASLFIEGLDGDYFNVVGLPVKCLSDLMKETFDLDPVDLLKP